MSQTGSYSTPQECEIQMATNQIDTDVLAEKIFLTSQPQNPQHRFLLLVLTGIICLIFSIAIALLLSQNIGLISNTGIPTPSNSVISSVEEKAEENIDRQMEQGIIAMHHQKFPLAIAQFSQLIENNSHLASAYSNRCLAYLNNHEYENAIQDCDRAINLNPQNYEAYLDRGISYFQLGNYHQAQANTEQIIKQHPTDFRAHYNRGLAIAAQGDYNLAIIEYQRALISFTPARFHPLSLLADIHNDLGLAQFHLHNFNAAINNFDQAINIHPIHESAHFNRGCTCGKQGDFRGAIRDFSHTVRLNPSNTNAYINRAMAYHRMGYESAALTDLQIAANQFSHLGNQTAHQHTLNLIKFVQQQIAPLVEVG